MSRDAANRLIDIVGQPRAAFRPDRAESDMINFINSARDIQHNHLILVLEQAIEHLEGVLDARIEFMDEFETLFNEEREKIQNWKEKVEDPLATAQDATDSRVRELLGRVVLQRWTVEKPNWLQTLATEATGTMQRGRGGYRGRGSRGGQAGRGGFGGRGGGSSRGGGFGLSGGGWA